MTSDDSRREFDSVGRTLVLLAFSSNFLWGCILKNLAVILPTLTDQFTTDAWVIGTVASLMTVASDITGLFAAPLEHVLGSRRVVSFSTVALCLGLLAVPFATRLLYIAGVVLLVGWIYDTRGSYDVAFVVFGFAPAVSLLPMIFLTTLEEA